MKKLILARTDVECAETEMFAGYSVLVRNNWTAMYGMLRFNTKNSAMRCYNKLRDLNNDTVGRSPTDSEYLEYQKIIRAGEYWEDGIDPYRIDRDGSYSLYSGDFVQFVNRSDPQFVF